MTREIGLVSCVKSKRDEPAPPGELYTSDYFEKMRSYAESNQDEWYILSAQHGLLDPDGEPIEPYDETLRNATIAEKREWAEQVAEQMDEAGFFESAPIFVIHAGKDYYGELIPLIEDRATEIEIPTEGLSIGNTKSWYKEQL